MTIGIYYAQNYASIIYATLPMAKKAFLAFLMFSFTDSDADDRFDCQHTPKHLAADVVVSEWPATSKVSTALGVLEIFTYSS